MEHNGIHRYDYIKNSDNPIVEQIVPTFESTWDTDKNDSLKRKEIRQRKFFRAVTGFIIKYRLQKRLTNLQKCL